MLHLGIMKFADNLERSGRSEYVIWVGRLSMKAIFNTYHRNNRHR
jgi:hypothetical protein